MAEVIGRIPPTGWEMVAAQLGKSVNDATAQIAFLLALTEINLKIQSAQTELLSNLARRAFTDANGEPEVPQEITEAFVEILSLHEAQTKLMQAPDAAPQIITPDNVRVN